MEDNRHMRVKFSIPKSSEFEYNNAETIVGKPIIMNEVPIGVITYAISNEGKGTYECEGIIWDRFISVEYSIDNNKILTVMGIVI